MIIHQAFAYAMFIMPVHHMWEKLIKTHDKPYWIRLPSRLPVGMLMFPSRTPRPCCAPLPHPPLGPQPLDCPSPSSPESLLPAMNDHMSFVTLSRIN